MSTDTILTKLQFAPTILRETTQYAAEGSWYSADKVRFRAGKPQNIRGWQKKATQAVLGTPRGLHIWRALDGKKYAAWGSDKALQLYYGGEIFDITPVSASVSVTAGGITTSSGSVFVHVSNTGHGRNLTDTINFVSVSALGGVSLQGHTYEITSVAENTFHVSVQSTAASNEGTSGTSFIFYNIFSGTSVATPGLGYGAADYGDTRASVTVGGVVTLGGWSSPAASSDITIDLRQWSLDNLGEDLVAAHNDGRIYRWFASGGPEVRAVEVSTTTTAGVSTGVPLKNDFILISPRDRHVISLGCTDFSTDIKDPMILRYSDQANINEWTPSVSTTSDQIRLGEGNRIIGALPSRDLILIWTDIALYGMQFVGPPFTFALSELGTQCGLISPHAAADFNGNAYWMGEDNFFSFDGAVKILPSTVRLYVFDDFNRDNKAKVFCGINQEFKEVIWLYPSADSSECDRYVIFSPSENYWTFGTSNWSTWFDKGVFDTILTTGVSSTGQAHLFDNEPPDVYTDENAQPIASYIESAEFDIQDGDDVLFVDRIIPDFDFKTSVAPFSSISIRLTTKRFPQDTAKQEKGPYTVTAATNKINTRARGRQARVRIDTSIGGAATAWRLGSLRLDIKPDGKR